MRIDGGIHPGPEGRGARRATEHLRPAGARAKRAGTTERNRKVWDSQTVWWQGHPIPYRSETHFELIQRALQAKFDQDRPAREALIATGDAELIHDTGEPESPRTSLPAARFLDMLGAIRAELLRA